MSNTPKTLLYVRERYSSRAFTLLELLVVLVVIGLLATLELTALTNSSTEGQSVACTSNLRQLTRAWLLYAEDNGGWFPPNVDTFAKENWVGGKSGEYPFAIEQSYLTNKEYAKLLPYLGPNPYVYKCPAQALRARNYSANVAVGTLLDRRAPVNGAWLDNVGSHTANSRYRTYGKLSDLSDQPPSGLWLLIGEDSYSINDCTLAFGMRTAEWIDRPETVHSMAAGISYVDGHAEMHRWEDSRTVVKKKDVSRRACPGSADWLWLSQRTTIPVY